MMNATARIMLSGFTNLSEVEPQPISITKQTIFQENTAFENFLFTLAHQQPEQAIRLLNEWIETLPSYDGTTDGSDVVLPGVKAPIDIPSHWAEKPVHFIPNGFANPKAPRLIYIVRNQYFFCQEQNLREWLWKVHGTKSPQRILDIGCGTGTTTFVYGELFPNADVIGIDLSAPLIRFCRDWKAQRGASKVFFYQENAEVTHWTDNSFDIVHFTYVLHEMPQENARKILQEMYRLLKPGGTFSAMEVMYDETAQEREARVSRSRAAEPFLEEYMHLNLPVAIGDTGFKYIKRHYDCKFPSSDGMFLTALKPNTRE
ncbi:class I SAM-dependent methyltransferase [Nostoc sp. NZL]|uniref:class I SAM-dependent methyltransferase n=1 Tax=Nostoc sp. NZL TaxID=2650612 RepID=UPI0018C793F8|nr:class I SAM-dependent methyltransferase [Nostoc sp. NZL]MBG1244841.1 class I SAM-dependent methyltransferase [Nostoc sp. NZL]